MNSVRTFRWLGMTLVSVMLSLQSSCLPDYFPRRDLKEQVSDNEVVGRWRLTKESAAMLAGHGATVSSDDSTMEFVQGGDCILHNFAYGDNIISGAGTWKIEHDITEGAGVFKKNELRMTVTSLGKPSICFLNFWRKHRRLVVWQYYGDPDGRQYIDYEHD